MRGSMNLIYQACRRQLGIDCRALAAAKSALGVDDKREGEKGRNRERNEAKLQLADIIAGGLLLIRPCYSIINTLPCKIRRERYAPSNFTAE